MCLFQSQISGHWVSITVATRKSEATEVYFRFSGIRNLNKEDKLYCRFYCRKNLNNKATQILIM